MKIRIRLASDPGERESGKLAKKYPGFMWRWMM
jgi:hypothetical protein